MWQRIFRRSVRRAGFVMLAVIIMLGIVGPTAALAAPAPATAVQSTPRLDTRDDWGGGGWGGQGGQGWDGQGGQGWNGQGGQGWNGQGGQGWNGQGGGWGGGGCSQMYVVRPGDTLSGIASWFGVSTAALAQANGIWNWSRIYVGQRLCIPGGYVPPQPWPPQPQPPYPPHPGWCGNYYTVRPGDTLSRIAGWCGTTVQNLMWLNNICNPNIIWVGQVLRTR